MGTKHWVDETHYRQSSDGGETSWLYEVSDSIFFPDSPVEYAERNSDGTTDAYEVEGSFFGILLHGGRGPHK
jgi:hypothetical protein